MMGIVTRMTLHKEYGQRTWTGTPNAFTKLILPYTRPHGSVTSSVLPLFPTLVSNLTQKEAKWRATNFA